MTPLENRARNSSYFFAIIRIKGFHALHHIRIVKLYRCWRTCVICSHCHALERRIEFLLFAVIQSHVNHKGFRLLFRVNSIRGSKSGITAYQWRHWRERGELLFPRVCQQPICLFYIPFSSSSLSWVAQNFSYVSPWFTSMVYSFNQRPSRLSYWTSKLEAWNLNFTFERTSNYLYYRCA